MTESDLNLKYARCSSEFTAELFGKLQASTTQKNIIVSPFSIQSCMAMVYAGAKDETAKEMSTALKYVSNCPDEVAQTFHNVMEQYKDSHLLKIANKICIKDGMHFKPEYAAVTKEKYHAEAESLDFSNGAAVAGHINKWVESKTGGKIKDVLTPSDVNSSTILILINALHFKGEWLYPFDERRTHDDEFYSSDGEKLPVKYMNRKGKFLHADLDDLNCSALSMPYINSDLSMFVLLPKEQNGLPDLLEKLKTVNMSELATKVREREIVLHLPKFKVEYDMKMSNVLQQMGVIEAFGGNADFSNMLDPVAAIKISEVYHKACIEVNEQGSEASAITKCRLTKRCAPRIPYFVANHPFVYVIWDQKTIMFAGTFVKPKPEESKTDEPTMEEN